MSIRTSIILLVLLAMIAGYVFFVQVRQTEDSSDITSWFYNIDLPDLKKITITDGDNESSFIEGDDRWWYFEDPEGLPVGQGRWEGITLLLTGPKSHRLLDEQPSDLEPYGLLPAQSSITMDLHNEETITILMGLPTPDLGNTYMQIDGFPQVFTIFEGWGNVIKSMVAEPPYPDWYYNIDTSSIVRIRLNSGDFTMELISNQADWFINDGTENPLDNDWLESFLIALEKPQSQELTERNPTDLLQYGLASPSFHLFIDVIRVDEAGLNVISNYKFVVGDMTKDNNHYYGQARHQETSTGDIFEVPAEWVDSLKQLAEDRSSS